MTSWSGSKELQKGRGHSAAPVYIKERPKEVGCSFDAGSSARALTGLDREAGLCADGGLDSGRGGRESKVGVIDDFRQA